MTTDLWTVTDLDSGEEFTTDCSTPDGPVRELHLVRIDDFEFYFFEFEDALKKLYAEPDATLERITVH